MSADGPAPLYPVFLNLAGRSVVIVGDGPAVERKASAFARYDANVIVISADATDRLREMEAEGLIDLEQRQYATGDLAGVSLVVCIGAPRDIGLKVARDADAQGCPVHVSNAPELSNYVVPVSLRRGPLHIAISTGGAAPSVAKRLRDEIKASYGDEWGTYVALLGSVRALAFERIAEPPVRDRVLAKIAEQDLLSRIAAGESLDPESVFAEFGGPADKPAAGATDSEE